MLALLDKIRKIFHPQKQSKILLVGRASDLIFQCNNEFPCLRGAHNPVRKKKALRRCWGCQYLEFTIQESKLKKDRSPLHGVLP